MPTLTQIQLSQKAIDQIWSIAATIPVEIADMLHSQQVVVVYSNGRYWVAVMGEADHEYIGAVSLEVDQNLHPLLVQNGNGKLISPR